MACCFRAAVLPAGWSSSRAEYRIPSSNPRYRRRKTPAVRQQEFGAQGASANNVRSGRMPGWARRADCCDNPQPSIVKKGCRRPLASVVRQCLVQTSLDLAHRSPRNHRIPRHGAPRARYRIVWPSEICVLQCRRQQVPMRAGECEGRDGLRVFQKLACASER